MSKPLTTAGNGRGPGGQFGAGNTFGRGNPRNAKAQELRNLLVEAVTEADVRAALEVYRSVMRDGKPNEKLAAADALLDRIMGKPVPQDFTEQIEELQQAVARLTGAGVNGGRN